ncbi:MULTISPECIES: IS630 family transposase [Acinetobacter]|uniref:IS630 family transposase n=1 Tax=Acinetobacter corruptisaponis TaxID=3045147 RepID=A0ABY8S7B6_9GAMM|nr:IS630 family transposase [Acinetobacter sp. KCTC 92772]WHP07590.1 IS630 family transposase [Acinetobacter sp. KCTC 92772]WHP07632.1 IS630 family transposase [Acinetobacter sp. KCTC 92772]WHP07654.1 IS630 family transposase [Acinetobacter sp. KCTC 92772]
MLPEHVALQDVEIWFQDETRIGQQGSLSRIWHYCGQRPRLIRQQQFLCRYIFGAICPEHGTSAGLILPQVNKVTMQLHMAEISKYVSQGKHAVVVMDGALWHQESLNLPNVSILKLPPYSPELNPMEQVWLMMKKRYLSNRCYSNIEAILDGCCQAWQGICEAVDTIKSLTQRQWAKI